MLDIFEAANATGKHYNRFVLAPARAHAQTTSRKILLAKNVPKMSCLKCFKMVAKLFVAIKIFLSSVQNKETDLST